MFRLEKEEFLDLVKFLLKNLLQVQLPLQGQLVGTDLIIQLPGGNAMPELSYDMTLLEIRRDLFPSGSEGDKMYHGLRDFTDRLQEFARQVVAAQTITAVPITDFTSANHDHSDVAGGGLVSRLVLSNRSIFVTTQLDHTGSPYTALSTDEVIFLNTDTAVITVTLPAGVDGKSYSIKNCGSSGFAVTVTPDGAENLFGEAASFTLYDNEVIDIHYETLEGWR